MINLPWQNSIRDILPTIKHHCLLFQGLAYTGVKELAFSHAEFLLKQNNLQTELLFHKHPDCHLICDSTGVDELNFLNHLAQKPHACKLKIIVIDLIQLTLPAMHVLLKSLEEPPLFVRFILYQENTKPILPTIASRALKINLPSPSFEVGFVYLQKQNLSPLLCELLAKQPLWFEHYDMGLHDLIMNYMLLVYDTDPPKITYASTSTSTSSTLNLIDILKKIGDHPMNAQINYLIAHIIHALLLIKLNLPIQVLTQYQSLLQKIATRHSFEKLEKLWEMVLAWNHEPKIAVNLKMVLGQFFSFYHSS